MSCVLTVSSGSRSGGIVVSTPGANCRVRGVRLRRGETSRKNGEQQPPATPGGEPRSFVSTDRKIEPFTA